MLNNKAEYDIMAEVETKMWWYKSLHNLVISSVGNNFDCKDIKILDAGCGTGGLLQALNEAGYNNVEGFDLCEHAVNYSKQRNLNVMQGDIKDIDKINADKSVDIIISNDTLYFFSSREEQKEILDKFYNVLKNNGLVILNLPALKAFQGTHDIAVGCSERFSVSHVKDIVNTQKFLIQKILFWPFLLSPLIFGARFLQRIKLIFSSKTEHSSDVSMPSENINEILYRLIEFENRFLKHKPFGSSLFVVLKKIN